MYQQSNFIPYRHKAFSFIEIAMVLLIVAFLMAGILNGTSLISDASVATAQKLTTNSEVNTMENLTLWLETSFTRSFESSNAKIENNTRIVQWKDISPIKPATKRFDLAQATQINQPQYKEDVTDGLPLIYFTNNNFLEFNQSAQNVVLADIFQQNQVTIFLICIFGNLSTGSKIINLGTNNVINFGYNGNKIEMKFADDTILETSDSFQQKKLLMLTGIRTNNNNIELYLNGNLRRIAAASSIISDNNFGLTANMRIRVGENFTGWLGEVLIFNKALTSKERIKVEQYLIKKWKIKN
jgi:hypothetical protein